jgi:flagella basal body P-ring formation protein FlgA
MVLLLLGTPTAIPEEISSLLKREVSGYLLQRAKEQGFDSVFVEVRTVPQNRDLAKEGTSIRVVPEIMPLVRGNCSVPIDIIQNEKVLSRLFVSARVHTYEKVYVVKNRIEKAMKVVPHDYEIAYAETTFMPHDLVKNSFILEKMRSVRMINPGTVLTESMFEPVPVIKPNDMITLVIRSGNILLSSRAVSKEAGSVGEFITIQRAGFHERLKARVLDEKTVEIEAP